MSPSKPHPRPPTRVHRADAAVAAESAPTRPYHARAAAASLGVALGAALLTCFFFSPRYVMWRSLYVPETGGSPEVSRARSALMQMDDPWTPIDDSSHQVIGWRLLFPIVWHYARIPRLWFLAMPQVGCVLALWLVAWLTQQRLSNWLQTFLATTLFAALPWFFVSTGWLAYFDSWLVLAMLTAAFVRARVLLAVACLLAPWIDERFVLALPVCMLVRAVALGKIAERRWRSILVDLAVVIVTSLPYPTTRAAVWFSGDANSAAYVQSSWEEARTVSLAYYLLGLWSGYRAAWVMIVAAVWLCGHRFGRTWGVVAAVLVGGTAVGALLIAADMSRSLAMLCPAVLMGILLWSETQPATFRWALPVVAVANLLLPASHVIWSFEVPIRYLYTEVDRLADPPPYLQPANFVIHARARVSSGDPAGARQDLETAIKLDGDFVDAYFWRAMLCLKLGDVRGATPDVDRVLQLAPDTANALFLRGSLNYARGDKQAAAADAERAIERAPAGWEFLGDAQRVLAELTRERGARRESEP